MNGDKLSQNVHDSSDDELDLLHSESSFLPVYSTFKETMSQSFENGDYPTNFEQSVMWDTQSVSVLENKVENFPIMTEEEANKLIHLAATILQAHIRGFLVRRKFDFKNFKRKHNAASKIQASWKGYHFRHRNYQGLNIKCELRTQRLQKYVATLGIMMQKVEKQHQEEKQRLLEVVSLLYGKFTQLFDKVEQQNVENQYKQNRLERNAAVSIQKYWRGYVVRKHHSRLKTGNAFRSLLTSHIQLKNKVKYLELSLAVNTETCDSVMATTQELHAAFLPHPRLFEENGNKDDVNESVDGEAKVLACSSDVSDAGEEEEAGINEDTKMSLREDIEEQDNSLILEDGGGEDIEDKEERVVHAMDNEDLVEELRFVEDVMGETSFDNVESNDEVSTEEIQDEYEQGQTEEDEHPNDVNQDVAQITDEEYDGEEGENENIVDQMINHLNREGISVDDEGVIDIRSDDSLETEEPTTEVEIEGMIGDQVLKGGPEESKEPEDHDGTVEETKSCSIEHAQEEYVEDYGGDESMDKKEDNKIVGDTEDIAGECIFVPEVQGVPTRSPSQDEQNSCCGEKPKATMDETGEISSREITQDITVQVEKCNDADLANFNEAPEETNIQEGFQGENESETRSSETDTSDVSPRLGKRASSLLSALKDEISNVRPKSPETEQSSSPEAVSQSSSPQDVSDACSPQAVSDASSPQAVSQSSSPQAVSHHSSSDPDNANTDEASASSECEVIASVNREVTLTVDNGDDQDDNLES